ncbi:hypothetical protein MKW98_009924 [Papaver atlanticum]|uniref:K Homology domain-containing protein n=1 Tax=Papaver atlanticum TaxID=357466 RepID=A0AAD4T4I9_9MAGN|nr:hypothetical protein MKW98_009924 [Papaver atlanticum]
MFANARRSFSRVDLVYKLANSYVQSKPIIFNKGYNWYHGLSFERISMDWKNKQKAFWKPVSTQAVTSSEGCSVKDIGAQTENEHMDNVGVVGTSTFISSVQDCKDNGKTGSVRLVSSDGSAIGEVGSIVSAIVEGEGAHSVNEGAKCSMSMKVAASLRRFVKGKGGSLQREIEGGMGVKIVFPPSKEEDSIVIEGDSMECVTKASKKIQTVLDKAVNSPFLDYSHFISLPLAIHPELVDKLVNFQSSILESGDSTKDGNLASESDGESPDDGEADGVGKEVAVKLKVEDKIENVTVDVNKIPLVHNTPKKSKLSSLPELGIEKSIFIKPSTFHLTVLMLKLWNKERIAAAAEVLQRVSSKVIDALNNRPLSIRLKGLENMRGSLLKAKILYIPVEEIGGEGRLLRACQIIIDAYVEAGLVLEKDAGQTLKLHATVMNARHRKRKYKTRSVDTFDAREVMKKYGSEEWGEYLIREAHLSQRFCFDNDGYYHRCGSFPFPQNK